MKVITACTDSNYYFPYLKKSCIENNGEFIVLGMGEKWEGYIWKMKKMLEYLKKLDSHEVVCFVDGYDVVCRKNLSDLSERFLKFRSEKKCKIVVGRDRPFLPKFINDLYFGTYDGMNMCLGTYIGTSGDILDILERAMKMYPDMYDDQMLFTKYANEYVGDVIVDSDYIFFETKSFPLRNIKPDYDAYFIHGPGCTYLDDILGLSQSERDKINPQIKKLFIDKVIYHAWEFFKKFILWIILFILIILLFLVRN